MVNKTRTEKDFVKHISDVVSTAKSESLIKYVAKQCDIQENLGKKGYCGILKTMEIRQAFLEDESHRIRIVYTPRHASWLNQIEIWFGILTRKVLDVQVLNRFMNLMGRY